MCDPQPLPRRHPGLVCSMTLVVRLRNAPSSSCRALCVEQVRSRFQLWPRLTVASSGCTSCRLDGTLVRNPSSSEMRIAAADAKKCPSSARPKSRMSKGCDGISSPRRRSHLLSPTQNEEHDCVVSSSTRRRLHVTKVRHLHSLLTVCVNTGSWHAWHRFFSGNA